jgi:type I restriction enzyme S subunit
MTTHIVEIGDFVDVVSGPAFKSSCFTDDPSDVPLIKGENVAQGYIAWDKSKFWPAADAAEYERFALGPGDIVLAMDRPWITAGLKWARLKPHDPPSLLVQRVARLRARKGLRQDFLTYVIGSAVFSEYVRNIMGGTNVPHISGAQIKAFKFRLPGENEQGAIADTLLAYDDLIENNRRRIALLEEAARMLYREWFVRFRFPGHEHVKIIDGIPEGWERRRLGSILTLKRGYDLPEIKRVAGEIPILSSSGITGFHNQYKAHGPGIVTGRYGTLGEVYYIDEDYWPLNTALYVSDFQGSHPLMLLHLLKVLLKGIIAEKAAVPGVDRNVLHAMMVIWPPLKLRNSFVEMGSDCQEQVRILGAMNQKLAQARDLLLPRLMNGHIAV